MAADRWQRTKQIVAFLLEGDRQDRTARMNDLCAGDAALLEEVGNLLYASDHAEEFLDDPGLLNDKLPKSISPGDSLGPYEISAHLDAGGMGDVWKARDKRLGRDVAIKINRQAFSSRFTAEVAALSKLNHPHICQIYDVGPNYIVMELIEGKPLRGPMALPLALTYAAQICSGLHAAHAAGIVHRDLKPANILVTRNGIKLLDFGLAKTIDPINSSGQAITQSGQVVGTLHYMSPEQLQGRTVDTRSDIFSLGVLLYELIGGRRPFEGENPASVIAAILKEDPKPIAEVHLGSPPELSRLVGACLAKDPDERWQSARDLQRELDWLRESPSRTYAAVPAFGWKKVLAATALMLGIGAACWVWGTRSAIPESPEWKVTPLTAYAGNEEMPALSPDGSRVAFVWEGEQRDNPDIYVKQVGDDAAPLRITQDAAAEFAPCWSPDGTRIAHLRARGPIVELVVNSALGGAERIVAKLQELPSSTVRSTTSWSPDGKFISAPDGSRIVRIDVESREIHPLTTPGGNDLNDMMPVYSPDGRSLAFTRGVNLINREIWLQQLDQNGNAYGSPKRIAERLESFLGLTWMPGRNSLLTSRGFPGSIVELLRVPLGGGPPKPMPVESVAVWYPSYNPAHRRLVYQRRWMDIDILRVSLDAPQEPPRPVVASTYLDFGLDLSPDGKRLLFVSTRDGRTAIWRSDRDGTNQILLAALPPGTVGSPRWSPDGKWCVFDGSVKGELGIYAVPTDGGTPKLLVGANFQATRPIISPDANWLYFVSGAGGRRDIWRRELNGDKANQLTHSGGDSPIPSPDGKWVYYSWNDAIWKVSAEGGREVKVLDGVTKGSWTVAGERLFYVHPERDRSVIMSYQPLTGESQIMYRVPFVLNPAYPVAAIGVSLKTREVFLQHCVRLESDLVLVDNFQ